MAPAVAKKRSVECEGALEISRVYELPELQPHHAELKNAEVEVWHEAGGKRWIKGKAIQATSQRMVLLCDSDKKETQISFTFKSDKTVKIKLRETVSTVYSGSHFIFSAEHQNLLSSSQNVLAISVELVFRDVQCKTVDQSTMYNRFIKERKSVLVKQYKCAYKTPQKELDQFKQYERDLAQLDLKYADIIARNDLRLNAALAAEMLALDTETTETLGSFQKELLGRKTELETEYNFRVQQAEAGLGGSSTRLALKMVDEWHRGEYVRNIRQLEKEVNDGLASFTRRRKQCERKIAQERQVVLVERDQALDNVQRHMRALELHWQWEEASEKELISRSIEYRANAEWVQICQADSRLAKCLDVCEKCRQDPGIIVLHVDEYPELAGSDFRNILLCNQCIKFALLSDKIQQLNLKPNWCKTSHLTAYGMFVYERQTAADFSLNENAKSKFQALDDAMRGLWERKRQNVLLELLAHIKETPTIATGSSDKQTEESVKDLCFACAKEPAGTCTLWKCGRVGCHWQMCGDCADVGRRTAVEGADFFCSLVCEKEAGKQRLIVSTHVAAQPMAQSIRIAPAGAATSRGMHRQSPDAVHLARMRRTTFLLRNWDLLSEFLVDGNERHMEAVVRKRQDAANALVNHGFQKEFLARIVHGGVTIPDLAATPDYITGSLRDYQLLGVNWLLSNWAQGSNACLADEMGAGKSFQVAAFLAMLKANAVLNLKAEPDVVAVPEVVEISTAVPISYVLIASSSHTFMHLIVCPLSVLPNWLTEIRRFTPTLQAMALYGPAAERERQKQLLLSSMRATGTGGKAQQFDVLVTTYETLVQEQNWFSGGAIHFECLILDEAQRVKSHESLVAKAVRNVKCSFKLLLTGTPIQNNLTELWSLLNFLYPEIFSEGNISQFTSAFSIQDNVRDTAFGEKAHKLLNLVMLRRLKSEVLKDLLPPKKELVLSVPLSDLQRRYYREFLLRDRGVISETELPGVMATRSVSFLLMQLWKCCLHPYLFTGGQSIGALESEASLTVDGGIVYDSGKMVFLDLILNNIVGKSGDKILIYSQFTSVLNLIQEYCIWRGRKALRLDGGTSLARRRFYMYLFNRKAGESSVSPTCYDIFLVSTKAGGTGINLQAASHVLLMDSSFNPFQDFQAMDRSHRVGQNKPVTVYRLLTKGTCEERIRYFAEQKVLLKDMVLKDVAEDVVLEADDVGEATPEEKVASGEVVSEIYDDKQVRDMVNFNADEFLRENVIPKTEDEFYEFCHKSLNQQLATAKQVVRDTLVERGPAVGGTGEDSPRKRPARNIDLRALRLDGSERAKGKEEDVVEIEGPRQRHKTTATFVDENLGEVEVDKWSLEQARHEEELAKRANVSRKVESGRKFGHEDHCFHCKEDLRIQAAVVSTEMDAASGRVVKRRRIASSTPNFLCPGCPVSLHGRCARIVCGSTGGSGLSRPNCPQHRCRLCERSGSMAGGLLFRCVDCITGTVCFDCAERLGVLEQMEFLENHPVWEQTLNFFPAGTYEYVRCAECVTKKTSHSQV